MTTNDYTYNLNKRVLFFIPKGKHNAIPQFELCKLTGLKPRELKEIITKLRKKHPICSKQTQGGGYWIAESRAEVKEFIDMIKARKAGYSRTISSMYGRMYEMER